MAKKGHVLIVLLVFLFMLLSAFSAAIGVTRTVSPSQPEVDSSVTVTLHVYVGDSDAYAIDETIPDGWSLVDAPDAITSDDHVMWLVCGQSSGNYQCSGVSCCIDKIEDTTYTYTLQAPSSTGTFTISGVYMFDSEGAEKDIPNTTVEVIDIPPSECSNYDGDESGCSSAALDCSWCPLNDNCEKTDDIDCTTAACTGNYICTSSCKLSACGVSKNCVGNACQAEVACVPDWVCTEWSPSQCPEDTQERSRTCTDNNNCSADKNETQACRVTTTTSSGSTTTTSNTRATTTDTSTAQTRDTRTATTSTSGTPVMRRTTDTTGNTSGTAVSTELRRRTETDRSNAEIKASPNQTQTESTAGTDYKITGSVFNILLIVLLVMVVVMGLYFWRKGIHFNRPAKVDLSAQKKFIQNQGSQQQDNKFRPF